MVWFCTVAARTATGAGSFGDAALVCSPLHAAESSAARAAPESRGARSLRIMTRVLAVDRSALVARIERKPQVAAGAGAEAQQRRVDRRARESVAVLAWREPIAEPQRRRAVRGGEQQPEDGMGRRVGRAGAGVDR